MSATAAATTADGRRTRHDARRREILDQAIQYVFENGLADLSIRPMAEAMGISHRTLLHHFGSKDEMIARVLEEVRNRELEGLKQRTLDVLEDPVKIIEGAWAHVSVEEREGYWRSFFEIYGMAVNDPERYEHFLGSVVTAWLPLLTDAVERWGVPAAKAEQFASLMQAGLRGLVLDLITTGDRKRVQASFRLFRDMLRRELDAARKAD